jgi:hypothetical protein
MWYLVDLLLETFDGSYVLGLTLFDLLFLELGNVLLPIIKFLLDLIMQMR